MKKLDIGSGRPKLDGYITLDKDPSVGADICLDFEKCKYEDLSIGLFDELRLHHVLEHFKPENKVKVLSLCWDLLKEGGILDIEVPLFPHPASVQDPTHISFWTAESFWYFTKGNSFAEGFAKRYSEYPVPLFEKVEEWYKGGENIYEEIMEYGKRFEKILKNSDEENKVLIENIDSLNMIEFQRRKKEVLWAYGVKLKKITK